MVLGDLYDRLWKALDASDEGAMNEAAAAIYRVGGTAQGLKSSMANKEKAFGKELSPDQRQQAIDALEWAYDSGF